MFTQKGLILLLFVLVSFTSTVFALEDDKIAFTLEQTFDAKLLTSTLQSKDPFSIFIKKSPSWASQNSTIYKYNPYWSLSSSIEISSISSTVLNVQNNLFCFLEDKSKLSLLSITFELDTSSIPLSDSISTLLSEGDFSYITSIGEYSYFKKGTTVFSIYKNSVAILSTDVLLVSFDAIAKNFVLVKQTINQSIVELRNSDFKMVKQEIVDKKDFQSIYNYSKGIVLTSTVGNYNQLITITPKNIRNTTVEVSSNLLCISNNFAYVLEKNYDGFHVNSLNLQDNFAKNELMIINDPLLFEPEYLISTEKYLYVFFRNGVIISDFSGQIFSKEYIQFGNFFESSITVKDENLQTLISNNSTTFLFKKTPNSLWWFYRIFYSIGQYFIIIVFLVFFIFGVRKYFQKNKILQTLLGLQTVGVVFVIDSLGRLTLLNDLARILLKIPQFDGLGRLYYYYFENKELSTFREFIEKSFTVREPISQEIVIESDEVNREFLISSTPILSSTGRFSGVLITAVEITEQLESKRLENWAHLAHDMQTNLSIVKLNAENIESSTDADLERIRKIVFQTKLLMQRIRDLVTVGKSSTLELESVFLSVMLQDVFNEFDPVMYPQVTFILKSNDFTMVCDPKKLSRAVRNAVENAIRSLQGNAGIVELSAWKETGTTFISINDTGVGMDEETKRNMLKPYFTTSKKYGGTGIGSIIMQKVLKLHNAEIFVESEVGNGTKIIFKIPEIIPLRQRQK
jgi:signal transduction histidine kinase